MNHFSHPICYKQGSMGGFLDDIKSWGQDVVDDLNKEYVDPALDWVGLSEEQKQALKQEAEQSFQEEVKRQEQELAKQIQEQLAPGSTGQTSPASGGFTDIVRDIEQSQVVKSIPGGIYTLGGAALVVLFLLMRGR